MFDHVVNMVNERKKEEETDPDLEEEQKVWTFHGMDRQYLNNWINLSLWLITSTL